MLEIREGGYVDVLMAMLPLLWDGRWSIMALVCCIE